MCRKLVLILLCSAICVGGARLSNSHSNQLNSSAAIKAESTNPPAFDACSLLNKSEIAAVQSAIVQQADPTSKPYNQLNISQCYYSAVSADGLKNLGVYLQVIRPEPGKAGREAIKEYWRARFSPEVIAKLTVEHEAKEKTRTPRQKAKAIRPPKRVPGVGDEAFWLASSRGGALFVLKKEKVVRISVGEAGDAAVEIEKAKALAKKALARLT